MLATWLAGAAVGRLTACRQKALVIPTPSILYTSCLPVTSLMHRRLRSGFIESPGPLPGPPSIRAGARPVTTYRIHAKRWVKPPLPTRPIYENGHP